MKAVEIAALEEERAGLSSRQILSNLDVVMLVEVLRNYPDFSSQVHERG